MKIRNFEKKDITKILELSSRFNEVDFLGYRDAEIMDKKQFELSQKSIETNSSNIFVADLNGDFLGYLEMSKEEDYFTQKDVAYIEAIAVSSDAEGQGVGKLLLKKAEDWCVKNNCSELVLDVFSTNAKAIRFYKNAGFEEEVKKMVKTVNRQ